MSVRDILAEYNTDIRRVFHAARYSSNPFAAPVALACVDFDAVRRAGGDLGEAEDALRGLMDVYEEWARQNVDAGA